MENSTEYLLYRVQPLLGNDIEIREYTRAITWVTRFPKKRVPTQMI
jgi:hypothetical protein